MATKKHLIRKDNFDMMRNTASSFQPQPQPQPVNTSRAELSHQKQAQDPVLDHLRGIRDTTPPRKGGR